MIYRVAQEALTNVLRHAAASQVTIRLTGADRGALLVVRDDGHGLPEAMREGGLKALANDVDLAILDVSMPLLTGLQATAELHARRPGMRVLILSVHVLKTAANCDLVAACAACMRGEPFPYPGAVSALIRDYLERARRGEATPEDPLTPASFEWSS